MTNPNSAAQAANENPLSDEYVNAIIQRHGYDSPEAVIARLAQWIGLHGGENGVTLLMYEAHKALSKLRAPVADGRAASINPDECDAEVYERGTSVGLFAIPKEDANAICAGIAAATGARVDWHYIAGRVHIKALPALASAPVAGEALNWRHSTTGYKLYDKSGKVIDPGKTALYAAPQASAEAARNAALEEAAALCESWMMAKTATHLQDMANQTMRRMADYIRALKQPQADKDGAVDESPNLQGNPVDRSADLQGDKDGGQQRAGDVPSDDALAQIGYAAAIAEVGWGEAWVDLESDGDTQQEWRAGAKAIRAALSSPQTEQGERDE